MEARVSLSTLANLDDKDHFKFVIFAPAQKKPPAKLKENSPVWSNLK